VIHGCYTTTGVNGSHALVLQDVNTACPSGDTSIKWNKQGPPGPQGAQGPEGPQGPTGPAGVSGYQVENCNLAHQNAFNDNPLCFVLFNGDGGYPGGKLYCPAGQVALSGGYQNQPGNNVDQALEMFPISDGNGSGYEFTFQGGGVIAYTTIYVTCANAS
jgi:hypothetical protein